MYVFVTSGGSSSDGSFKDLKNTYTKRPELLEKTELSKEDIKILNEIKK